jgi:hypothetical protein
LGLIINEEQSEQKEQPQPQQQQSKQQQRVFYTVRKKSKYGEYHVVSYIDRNGSFRGPACFDIKTDAENYLEEYAEKLARLYLKEGKGAHGNLSNMVRGRQNSYNLCVFCESSYPDLRNPKILNYRLKNK